jgi:hypothetical protein
MVTRLCESYKQSSENNLPGGDGGGFRGGGPGGGPGGFGMLPIDIDSFQLFFDVTTKTRPGTKVTFIAVSPLHARRWSRCARTFFRISRNGIDRSA